MFAHAVELASVGSWEIDLRKNTAIWSPQFFRMLGVPPQKQPMRPDYWMTMIHPDDRDAALKRVETLRENGKPVDSEVRFVTPGRGVRIFHTRSVAIRDKSGKIVGMRGMTQDVTEQREAEDKLRERTTMVEHAEEVAKLGSWRYDYANDSFTLSPNMRRILGIGPDDPWTSGLYWSRVVPEDRERALAIYERATQERKPFEFVVRFAPMNGGRAYLHTRGITFCDESGKLTYRVGVVQDISERHEAEFQLREREALLAHAERIANLGSYEYDFASNTAILSPNLRDIYGFLPEPDTYREKYWERVHPEDREQARKTLEDGAKEKKAVEFVVRFMHPERGLRYLHASGVPVLNEAGEQVRRVGVVRDITDRYEADRTLREREALLAHAEQLANMGSYRYDHGIERVTPSENLTTIYGFAPGEKWSRADFWARMHPEDRDWAAKIVSDSVESKQPFDFVARYVHPERGVRYLHTRGVPVLDEPSDEFRRVGVVQDITEQYEIERQMREREALFQHAEEIARLGSWRYDFQAELLTLSPQLRKIYGLRLSDRWTNDLYWSRVHPADRERVRALVAEATREKKGFECEARFVPLEGAVRHMHLRAVPVFDAAGNMVERIGVAQDVTERIEAHQRLSEREQLLAEAEEVANFGSWQYDFATDRLSFSTNLQKIIGLQTDESWSGDTYWDRVHEDDRARAREVVGQATKDRQAFEYVTRFVGTEGGVRYIHVRGAALFDEGGNAVRRVGVAQDITEHVRTEEELRRLSQQLIRTRDEERRQIARELHETAGQSLAAIKMTLGRLRDGLDETNEAAHSLLRSAVELADAAVREVRTVSYLMHPPMLDEAGLGPALRWYARGFSERSGIRVEASIPERLPRQSQEIETTIFRIVQEALTNVHRYSQSSTAQVRIWLRNGDIHAEVRDQGRGFSPRGRFLGEAAALGVGIAGMRERVAQLRGVFELESAIGEGTSVCVSLPTAAHVGHASDGADGDRRTRERRKEAK